MSDVRFELTGVPRSAKYKALRVSILKPLCRGIDISDDESIKGGVRALIDRWRLRVNELKEAGWGPANTKRYQYMRNCPPAMACAAGASAGGQPKTLFCNADQVCPWCWGRTYTTGTWDAVIGAMERLDCLYRKGRTGPYPYRLALFRCKGRYKDSGRQPGETLLMTTGLLERAGNRFAKGRVAMATLGTLSPVGKRWEMSFRVLALVPPDLKVQDGTLILEHPTLRNVATVVGKFSRYPSGMLNGNVDMTLRYLASRSQYTFFRRSGLFRAREGTP